MDDIIDFGYFVHFFCSLASARKLVDVIFRKYFGQKVSGVP